MQPLIVCLSCGVCGVGFWHSPLDIRFKCEMWVDGLAKPGKIVVDAQVCWYVEHVSR